MVGPAAPAAGSRASGRRGWANPLRIERHRRSRPQLCFGSMDSYWRMARQMLRYRRMVVLSLVCALFGATGLGVGIVAALPVLRNILDPAQRRGLPELAGDLNADLPAFARIPGGVVDRLPPGPYAAIVWIVVGLSVLAILGGLANFLHARLAMSVVYRTIANIRRQVFRRVVRLPMSVVLVEGVSDTISRIVNDTMTLAGGLNALLSKAVTQVGKGLAAFVAALVIDWRLTLGVSVVAPGIAWVIRRISRTVRQASTRALEKQADLYGAAAEALEGLRVVKVHTAERYEAGRFHRINKDVMRQTVRARAARAFSSPLNEVMGLLVLGVLTVAVSKPIIDQRFGLDAATFLMTLGALGLAAASLKPVAGIVNDIQAAGAAADRVARLLDAEPEPGHGAKLPKLARHVESLRFEGVRYAYPGAAEPAIDGVTLEIAHGETVAVVGPNGSGKTTLLAMVPRLFDPDAGRVLIDGHDLREHSVRSVRRQIGVVTQETVIFKASVRENIAYGAENASPSRIEEAAVRARAHEFICDLPRGYDTIIGERGMTLSGGQRQRIAIARAVLRDPSILILDEATSMIDSESEARIAAALEEFTAGRTCLIVAHRLSTVLSADRIVVMERGRIVGEGLHDRLLETSPAYRQIAARQLVPAE